MRSTLTRLAAAAVLFAGSQAASAQVVVNEKEPNNSRSQAQSIDPNQLPTILGKIATASDLDYYRVSFIPGGECLVADLTPNASSNYDLRLVNNAGTTLAFSSNGVGQQDFVQVCNVGGPIFVEVRYVSGLTGASGNYTLTVSF